MLNYKKNNPLESRLNEAYRVKLKHPDKIPIIITKSDKCNKLGDIDRNKYLVANNLLCSQLIYIIKKRINIKEYEAIFILCDTNIISPSNTIEELYHKYKDSDGFLYIQYTSENTFG